MNRAPDTKYVMRRPNLSLHGPCNNTPTMFSTSVAAQMLLPGIVLGMVAGGPLRYHSHATLGCKRLVVTRLGQAAGVLHGCKNHAASKPPAVVTHHSVLQAELLFKSSKQAEHSPTQALQGLP
jgi:hypothetical protein